MKKYYTLYFVLLMTAGLACNKDSAQSLKTITGSGGSLARFAISGGYLYMVDKADLMAYSLADPADPVLKSTTRIGFEIETIYPFQDKLFIGSTSVVHIFSIEDPEHPEKLSTAISPEVLRRCDPVVAKDSVAYATLRTNNSCGGTQSILAVYDIRDITNPVQVSTYPVNEPYGLGYSDSALYVCDVSSLLVFDIKNPYSPMMVKSYSDNSYIDVIPYGNILICWVKGGVMLYNISDRLDPKFIDKIM